MGKGEGRERTILHTLFLSILAVSWIFLKYFFYSGVRDNCLLFMLLLCVPIESPSHDMPCKNFYTQDAISWVLILNNDQLEHQKILSANNRINSRINQQHTPFLPFGFLAEDKFCLGCCICLMFTSLSCMESNFLPNRKGE